MDEVQTVMVLALCLSFGINWVGWAISSLLKTEKAYDGTGTLTFIAVILSSLLAYGTSSIFARQILISLLVIIWTSRLGLFLVYRVVKTGGDSRFTEMLEQPRACVLLT